MILCVFLQKNVLFLSRSCFGNILMVSSTRYFFSHYNTYFTMKTLLALLLTGTICSLKAQKMNIVTTEKGDKITQIHRTYVVKGMRQQSLEEYKGSMFFNDTSEVATFEMKGKTVAAPIIFIPIREEFVAEVDNKQITFSNTDFTLGEHHFIAIKERYYELLQDGAVKILKKYVYTVKSLNRDRGGLYTGGVYEGKVMKNEAYFLQFPDGKLQQFELNAASLSKALEKENHQLSKNILYKNLTVNCIEDVKRVFMN
jgi:hypothetical protein